MINWYKMIDIYVQPSKQEGLPRSVIEAMSVGCPVAGSNIAGIPELIDGEYLFNPNRNAQIQFVITEMLSDRNKLLKQAARNFEKAKEYNLKDIEKRRQEVFCEYKDFVKRDNKQ